MKTLTHKDIYLFEKIQKLEVNKILKLREVKMCSFRKGCFDLSIKYSHLSDESFITKDILKPEYKQMIYESFESKTSLLSKIEIQQKPKGLTEEKLKASKQNYNCIPIECMPFFDNLPKSNQKMSFKKIKCDK